MIPISKNGPDMASVHKFWYFLLVTYSFSLKNSNFWTKLYISGVFSMGATGAMAPVILRKRLIAPTVSTRNGKILLTLGTRTFKILNTPLYIRDF